MTPYYETELGKLYHGDCLQIMPELEPVDLVLTDPPYGFGQNIVNRGDCPAYKDSYEWNDKPPPDCYFEHLIENFSNLIIFGGNYFPVLWNKPCRGFIFWDKIQCSKNHADGELVWTSFDRNAKQYKFCFSGNRYGWEGRINGVGKPSNRVHPTQKPTGLIVEILKDYSEQSDVTLDPMIGSGTTAIACERLKRKWIGIEIEEKYCEIAAKRIEQERKQLKLF